VRVWATLKAATQCATQVCNCAAKTHSVCKCVQCLQCAMCSVTRVWGLQANLDLGKVLKP
jgi:hypothetical protein